MRISLGAGRARLVRQLLVEALALAIPGGIVGVLAATWGVDALVAAAPESIPRLARRHRRSAGGGLRRHAHARHDARLRTRAGAGPGVAGQPAAAGARATSGRTTGDPLVAPRHRHRRTGAGAGAGRRRVAADGEPDGRDARRPRLRHRGPAGRRADPGARSLPAARSAAPTTSPIDPTPKLQFVAAVLASWRARPASAPPPRRSPPRCRVRPTAASGSTARPSRPAARSPTPTSRS